MGIPRRHQVLLWPMRLRRKGAQQHLFSYWWVLTASSDVALYLGGLGAALLRDNCILTSKERDATIGAGFRRIAFNLSLLAGVARTVGYDDREEIFILPGRVSSSLRARSQWRKLEVKFPQVISTSPRLSVKLTPTQPQLV